MGRIQFKPPLFLPGIVKNGNKRNIKKHRQVQAAYTCVRVCNDRILVFIFNGPQISYIAKVSPECNGIFIQVAVHTYAGSNEMLEPQAIVGRGIVVQAGIYHRPKIYNACKEA